MTFISKTTSFVVNMTKRIFTSSKSNILPLFHVTFLSSLNLNFKLTRVLIIYFLISIGIVSVSATNYYSSGNNAPNLTASWWIGTNGTGTHPSNFTTAGNVFIIQSGHTMATTNTWIVSGTGSTIQINTGGKLVASNAVTATVMTVASGGTYQHNQNGGTIPAATWDAASTCYITGITGTSPSGYNQTFGNFTWENAQTTYLTLGTTGTNATMTIQGNLTIARTGSSNNDFAIEQNLTIGGNLIITNSGGNPSTYRLCYGQTRNQTVNGDLIITGGTLELNTGTNASYNGILNVKGNFTHTSGTINETGTGTGTIVFNGSSIQTYTSGGTLLGPVIFIVNSGAYLQMGTGAAPAVISSGSSGTFTLSSGATLGITSVDGITTTGNAFGNIQVTGTRTYTNGANYIYNGTSAQNTGNGLTQNTPVNLTINNSAGVTLSALTNLSGNLNLTSGNLTTTATNFIWLKNTLSTTVTGSASSYVNGPLQWSLANGSSYLFPVGDAASNFRPFELNSISGTSPVVRVTMSSAGASTVDATLSSVAPRNWYAQLISGSMTSATVGITETGLGSTNLVASSTAQGGTYTSRGGNSIGASITSNVAIPITTSTYFAIGTTPSPNIVLSDNGTQVAAANIANGTTNVVLHQSKLAVITANATLSGMTCTTAGTYLSADITNLKVWYSTSNTFSVGGSILLSTLTTPDVVGAKTFPTFTSQTINNGSIGYIYITADVAVGATASNTINVNALTTGNFTFTIGTKSGSTTAGGVQTFVTTYYNKSSGANALQTLSNWGINTDGTGTAPTIFSANNQIFNIYNGTTATIGGAWTVSGTNSKVIVGNAAVAAINFTIPTTYAFTGPIDIAVASSGSNTLTIQNTTIPTLGSLNVGSTVDYNGTTQTVASATYGILNISAIGTKTAGGNIIATTVDNGGTLNVAAILDMVGNTLTASTIDNAGATIKYSGSTNGIAVSTGTIEYSATAGGQTVAAGTYNTLTLDNTSSTNSAGGNIIATTLNTTAGGTLNMVANTLSVTTPNNSGTIRTQNTSATPITAGKTWGGTVTFDGVTAQTIPASTFNNFTLNNAAGASLSGAENVGGILTLTSGVLSTTPTNLLWVTNTSSAAVTGSATSYVNGPLQWSLANGSSYLFPVGDFTNYRPFELNSITCASPVVRVIMSSSGASTVDATLSSVAARNWYAQLISGSFTSATVRIAESGLVSTSLVASSSAQAGQYTTQGGNSIDTTISSNAGISLTGSTYFAIGAVPPNIVLSDNGTQVTAANVAGGTSNLVLHRSTLAVSLVSATLTGMTCTTAGTYISADITNLKVWFQTTSTFNSGTATLLSTLTTPGIAGSKTFSSFTSQGITNGTTGYIFITADVAGGATIGNTINLSALTTANFTFSSGSKSGSTTVGGVQTFTATVFYNKSGGTLETLANWGTNTDGSGSAPLNFTNNNQIFNIYNGVTATIGGAWTVSGAGSKVILGNAAVAAINFTIPVANAYTGLIDIAAALSGTNTLIIQNTTIPTFGVLNAGSTINYNGTTQTVTSGTYPNLIISATGTKTAGGNITATTLDNGGASNVAAILDMGLNTLIAGTIDNTGATIKFSGTMNGQAIPTGTIEYSTTFGGQTIANGTYTNLSLDNTSGSNVANGTLTVNGTLLTTAGGTLNMGTNQLLGTLTTITNGGTVQSQYIGTNPIPSGKTWNGTVLFNGVSNQSIPASTFANLIINNTAGATLSAAVNVSNSFSLINGVLTTTSTNLLSVINSASTSITGGSPTNFISGPLAWTLPPSLATGSNYHFPVGKGGTYFPFTLVNPTTGTGVVTAMIEAFTGNCGGNVDGTLNSLSTTEYWNLTTTGNFTNSNATAYRQTAITPNDVLAGSPTTAGTYTLLGGNTDANGVSNTNLIGTNRSFAFAQSKPLITTSVTTLTGFTYPVGFGPSAVQTFTVSGSRLTSNMTITQPASFEISTSNSPFVAQDPIVLTAIGGIVNTTTIYVRMIAGLPVGAVSAQNVVCSATGAGSKNVACSGNVVTAPVLTASAVSGSFSYSYKAGPSGTQTFTISGTNLGGSVILTPPADFEISTNGGTTYQSIPVTLAISSGNASLFTGVLNLTTITVRMVAGLGVGSYSENIVASTISATSKNVLCIGTVNPVPTIYNAISFLSGFIYTYGAGPSGIQSFVVKASGLTADVTVTPPTNFEISKNGTTFQLTPLTLSRNGTVLTSDTIVYVRMKSGLAVGTYGPLASSVVLTTTNATTESVACTGQVVAANTPQLLTSVTLLSGFGYLVSTGPSAPQVFTVSGASLNANVILTAPTNYEISFSLTSGYNSSLSISPVSKTVNPTFIYVRLKSGLAVFLYGTFSTPVNLTVISTGATSINVGCIGEVYATPSITASNDGPKCEGSTINLSSSGANVSSQYWTGPNSYYSILANPVLTNATTGLSGTYTVTGNFILGGNLITNGDFSAGNVGFASGYAYVDTTSTTALWNEGLYTVVKRPYSVHPNFTTSGDHTTGRGMQMVVNGNPTAGVVVWSQSVSVIPGAKYVFSYWEQTVNVPTPANPSQLQLYVNGIPAGQTYTASATVGQWTQFFYNTTSGSSSVLNLELINQNTILSGNDFALDDIVFQQILTASASTNVTVNSISSVSVIVVPSSNPVYSNTPVTFTASPTNGGSTPTYQWQVNGVNVGANSPTYTYIPSNGNVVKCILTSNLRCVTNNPAFASVTMTVNNRLNYWKGSVDNNWGNSANWTANSVPLTGDDIEFATVPNYGSPANNDLILDQNRTIGSLINATSNKLLITPGSSLLVNNYVTTDGNPDRIYIQSSTTLPNGSLIFNQPSLNPSINATVEMNALGKYDAIGYTYQPPEYTSPVTTHYSWQYFGIPLTSVQASPTFDGSYVRQYDEFQIVKYGKWTQLTNSSILSPYKGYEITQTNPRTIVFQGQLINNSITIPIAYTVGAADPGQNILSNPYTAGISIKQLIMDANTEQGVYLYNTGAFGQWGLNGAGTYNQTTTTPGQYLSVPQNVAGTGGLPAEIPSMQGFLVKTLGTTPGNLTIPYNSVITSNSHPLRAPNRYVPPVESYIKIMIKSASTWDYLWLFKIAGTSHNFDNGWDGYKMLAQMNIPQIFAMESSGIYQINTADDINYTTIGILAGSELQDTLIITNENLTKSYQSVYLVDMVENKTIDITTSGTIYPFIAASTTTPVKRFKIVTQNYDVTENKGVGLTNSEPKVKIFSAIGDVIVQNMTDLAGDIVIYDIAGRYLKKELLIPNGIVTISGLLPGAYIVKTNAGNKVFNKKLIVGN